jgi:hypothetical protein
MIGAPTAARLLNMPSDFGNGLSWKTKRGTWMYFIGDLHTEYIQKAGTSTGPPVNKVTLRMSRAKLSRDGWELDHSMFNEGKKKSDQLTAKFISECVRKPGRRVEPTEQEVCGRIAKQMLWEA